jgi:hypothetical protein
MWYGWWQFRGSVVRCCKDMYQEKEAIVVGEKEILDEEIQTKRWSKMLTRHKTRREGDCE